MPQLRSLSSLKVRDKAGEDRNHEKTKSTKSGQRNRPSFLFVSLVSFVASWLPEPALPAPEGAPIVSVLQRKCKWIQRTTANGKRILARFEGFGVERVTGNSMHIIKKRGN
jgi:hypothetical protein